MADFDAIKISELTPTEVVSKEDLLVIDRLQPDSEYITYTVTIGNIVDFITTLDLNFTGDVTFIGTIQPPPTLQLDAIFDNVYIRQSITFEDGVEVNGLYLNDLDDVVIDQPEVGETLVYQIDPITKEGLFKNSNLFGDFVTDAPSDGQVYARKNGEWKDITDCIRCPVEDATTIGDVTIVKDTPGRIIVGDPVDFTATVNGDEDTLVFKWSTSPNTSVIVQTFSQRVVIDVGSFVDYIASIISVQDIGDYTLSMSGNTISGTNINFAMVGSHADYSWSTSTNSALITLRNDQTKSVNLTEVINYIVNWVMESPGIIETPEEGIYEIHIDHSSRKLDVIKKLSTGVRVSIDLSSGVDSTQIYDWEVDMSMASIRNLNSDTTTITFGQAVNYAVICTVTSPDAVDSPRTGVYEISIADTYRILTDPNEFFLQTHDRINLIYET